MIYKCLMLKNIKKIMISKNINKMKFNNFKENEKKNKKII